ncbi:serine protease [Luteimonas soli]|uniref:Serine protease n=1 Tax=Luteimonas soli TaxID=1648966 RepID=A0ABV7XLN1_9GAMM
MTQGISGALAGRAWFAHLVLIAGMAFAGASPAASLAPERLPAIQAATFEVVAAKPVDDPLTYEKPLPLDLLPFQQRNDKYYSIGTAFSIGDGRYVTAAHVLMAGANSLWGPPALRDNGGEVYAIDKVVKFSMQQDFVVFTLAEQPGSGVLEINTGATAGQTVYSVGNAYGTGVVLRDGLYTSDTPEQQDGRWNWVRFSAAASPGNSGGPLLDQDGKVIGVVMAKSPNENLNYALPIGLLMDAPEGVADIDVRTGYQFDVFDSTLSGTLKERFALPLPLDAFFDTVMQRSGAYFDSQLAALLEQQRERLFPNGEGSTRLLHEIADMGDFPKVIARNSNGAWVLAGNENGTLRLSANGYLSSGAFGRSMLFHLRRPDDIPADALYSDPAVAMDLLLKSGFIKRPVGSDNVMVTSLGKPVLDTAHTDAWGRRWQVWEWPLAYANSRLVVLALPVPNGYVGLVRFGTSVQAYDQLINAKALADFIYVNYDGTLAQWRDYLGHGKLHPAALADIDIDFEYGKRFRYASPRLDVATTPGLQPIEPDSVLTLGFAFFRDGGKVTWDVGELWMSARANDPNYIMVVREQEPAASMGDEDRNDWDRVLGRRHPYNAIARDAEDRTRITAVVDAPAASGPGVLYTAHYVQEGKQSQEAMKAGVDLLLDGIEVHEH